MEPAPLIYQVDIWFVGGFVRRVPGIEPVQSYSNTIISITPHIPNILVVHVAENEA
jgi:hypothetical protein